MNEPSMTLPRIRSHFQIVTPRPAPKVVAIIDQNDGAMSVTNDAEAVVERLYILGVLRPEDKLIYRDTDGIWDGLAHRNKAFLGFVPLRSTTIELAIRRLTW